MLRFVVEDKGPGIDKAYMNQMFVPFTKVNNLSEGLGLGLPLTKRHAENLGGDMIIDTSYIEGCRIILEAPHLELNLNCLQILSLRTIAVEYLVGTRLGTHGVGLWVKAFKTLLRKTDRCGASLSGLHFDTLEAPECFQRSLGICRIADIEPVQSLFRRNGQCS